MELQIKARNNKDNHTWFGTAAEGEKEIVPTIIGGVGTQLRREQYSVMRNAVVMTRGSNRGAVAVSAP